MYICLCNPTTDSEIRAACNTAASCEELKNKLRICQCCKSCSKEIDLIYQTESNSHMQPPRQVVSKDTQHGNYRG